MAGFYSREFCEQQIARLEQAMGAGVPAGVIQAGVSVRQTTLQRMKDYRVELEYWKRQLARVNRNGQPQAYTPVTFSG